MIGEKFLCTEGFRNGEYFKAKGQNPETNTLSLESLVSGETIEWNFENGSSEFLIKEIENGIFFDIRKGVLMMIDSDPVYENQGYYVYFNYGDKVCYYDFIVSCKSVVSFKMIKVGDHASVMAYPDILLIDNLPLGSIPTNYSRSLLKSNVIYLEGFWLTAKKPGFLGVTPDGYLDW